MDRSEIQAYMQKVQAGQATLPSPEEIERLMQEALESTFHQLRGLYYDTALSTNNTVLSALQRLVPASQILLGLSVSISQLNRVRAAHGLSRQAPLCEKKAKHGYHHHLWVA